MAARVALGSLNPAKRAAVERAVDSLLPGAAVAAVEVPSGVPAQPRGDEETARGARERADRARAALDADYGVGVESGVTAGPGGALYVVAWAAAVDRAGRVAYGGSERFPLPAPVAAALGTGSGVELGAVIDDLVGEPGLARREGGISVLTGGRRERPAMLEIACLHALAALLEVWRERVAPR
ncbi:MAG TPA: inosine/xanthosine triphosphatase [Thermomicrobiaceae bacterium]|nr:inosine/xanthosine triphosphatase [Thermomicrobiaceae bacterium]